MLHERADAGHPESRDGVRVLRAVKMASEVHGLHGVADVVEMRGRLPYPVEYKRGRPKAHRADEVQLCGQAICLEEMTDEEVPEGALFSGRNRRRKVVAMDAELRALTLSVASEARMALDGGALPPPVYEAGRCQACSLIDSCRPQAPRQPGSGWMALRIARAGVPEQAHEEAPQHALCHDRKRLSAQGWRDRRRRDLRRDSDPSSCASAGSHRDVRRDGDVSRPHDPCGRDGPVGCVAYLVRQACRAARGSADR